MLNQDVDDLIESLTQLRLRRETTLRVLGDINIRETEILEDLATATTAAAAATAEPDVLDTNPHNIGDEVYIGNNLRNEFGVRGVVIRSGNRLVTIRNMATRNTYTRAWWNLHPIDAHAPPERR